MRLLEAYILVCLILLALLTCFGVAALAEFRSSRKGTGLFVRMIEIACGMIATCALASRSWGTGLFSARLSWAMVCVLLLLSSVSLLSKYASRAALTLVLFANGLMGLFWFYGAFYDASHDVTDDRTASIRWTYEWNTEDPAEKVKEKYFPGTVTEHGAILFPPVYGQNGTIYLLRQHDFSTPKGLSLVAVDPDGGWEVRPDGGICTLPAIADDGTILFGTAANDGTPVARVDLHAGQGIVWAVSPQGKKKWTYESPPATFVPSHDFGGGAVRPAKSPACSQPAIAADGTSYWLGHGVYALTSEGVLRWSFDPGKGFYSVALAEDGSVYALANGALFALAPDGTQKWKYSFEKSEYFSNELALGPDGTVYLANRLPGFSSPLFALTSQGTLKWRNESYQLLDAPLVAPDGTLYVTVSVPVEHAGNEKAVVALDRNGEAKWQTPNGSELLTIASDGTVFVCYVRRLFAFSRRGEMLWKAQLPDEPSIHVPTKAVTLGPNGKFYIGDFVGQLGTLDAPAGLATSGWPARFHDARNTARAGASRSGSRSLKSVRPYATLVADESRR